MTERDGDPWGDLPRLADPLGDAAAPSPDDAGAQALLEEITMSGSHRLESTGSNPWYRKRGVMAAAAVALVAAVIGGVVAIPGRDGQSPAAAAAAAIEATNAATSGQFEVDKVAVAGDRTGRTDQTVRFNDADWHRVLRYDGFIIDDALPAELLEVASIDGEVIIRVEPFQPVWVATEPSGEDPPFATIGEQLQRMVDEGNAFERCDDGAAAYCTTTTDAELVTAFELGGTEYTSVGETSLRLEVDASTGLLSRVVVEATDAIVGGEQAEFLDIPPIDTMTSVVVFSDMGEPVTIDDPRGS